MIKEKKQIEIINGIRANERLRINTHQNRKKTNSMTTMNSETMTL